MDFKFEKGKPACPISCKYCFITEHEERRELWNKNPLMGVNSACTFLNVPYWIDDSSDYQNLLLNFDYSIFRSDIVGFTAISDTFYPKIFKWFEFFVERLLEHSPRLITTVSKWPINQKQIDFLKTIPNYKQVLTITGNENIEKVSSKKLIDTYKLLVENGIDVLPVVHPYISGESNIDFLNELSSLGCARIDFKGFRYGLDMNDWMKPEVIEIYKNHLGKEYLHEDGWRSVVEDLGFKLISPKEWYLEGLSEFPILTKNEALSDIEKIKSMSNIVTSSNELVVRNHLLKRKLYGK